MHGTASVLEMLASIYFTMLKVPKVEGGMWEQQPNNTKCCLAVQGLNECTFYFLFACFSFVNITYFVKKKNCSFLIKHLNQMEE